MNLVVLKGNLARDPEIKNVQTGSRETQVANFTIAVSRFFKKADGERDKVTTFIDCEAWDTGAKTIGKILKKGDPVLIEGSLKVETWEQDDGKKRSRMKVRVGRFDKLYRSSFKSNEDDANNDDDTNNEDDNVNNDINADDVGVGEDIPF